MLKHNCNRRGCSRIRSEFGLFLSRRLPPRLADRCFCSDACLLAQLEHEVVGKWDLVHVQRSLKIPRPKIGTLLLQNQYLTREQLDAAIAMQLSAQEGRLGEWLVRLGYVKERQITLALARQWGMPLIDLQNCDIQMGAVRLVPGNVAACGKFLPVGYDDDHRALRIAVANPIDPSSKAAMSRMLKKEIVAYLGDQSAIQKTIERLYPPDETESGTESCYGSRDDLLALTVEIARQAIHKRAVNIHFELMEGYAWIRVDFQERSRHEVFHWAPPRLVPAVVEHPKPSRMAYAGAR